MPDTGKKKKLTRGKGDGNVIFGSEVEEAQAAAVEADMPQLSDLLTPTERFDRIEKAISQIAARMPPGDQSAVMRELKGE